MNKPRMILLLFVMASLLGACDSLVVGEEGLSMEEFQATSAAVIQDALTTPIYEVTSEASATLPPTIVFEPVEPTAMPLPEQPEATVPPPVTSTIAPTPTAIPEDQVVIAPPFWEVYFTNPAQAESGQNPIMERLITEVNAATVSIHIAAFEFDLLPVAEALIDARERGVDVVWIADDEYGILEDINDGLLLFPLMENGGITVLDDERSGLMHDKFIIFDNKLVWTGSTNITENGTLRNNNNVILLHSPEVAAIYESEFQEMVNGKFGIRSPSNVAEQWAIVDGVPIQVFFGAEDSVISEIARQLDRAEESVRFMAFSFTHEALGFIMRILYDSGVDVAGVFEARGAKSQYSEMPPLFCAGIPVRTDGNPRIMHHKVIIIDEKIVITGSFNFSANADESNDENVIVIGSPELAQLYLQEFERVWNLAKDPVLGDDLTCD